MMNEKKTVKVYANYGELAAENIPLYRTAPGAVSEEKTIILPDGFDCFENDFGTVIETPNGLRFAVNEIVKTAPDGSPVMSWVDDEGTHSVSAEIM